MREEFWKAFDDAEELGEATVMVVADMAYLRWRNDIHELTDLIMVINHKSWSHHDCGNDRLSELYAELYYKYYDKAINYLDQNNREEELTYFIRTLD